MSFNSSDTPIFDLEQSHDISRDFPFIYLNLILFYGKKQKFCMLEHNTFVYSNPTRVIFPHEMKSFPLMTLLLHYVIWDGVATSHVIFIHLHESVLILEQKTNSVCLSPICLYTATLTE